MQRNAERKKLHKSKEDRILGGVCGGLGDYFRLDPTIIRLAMLALFFLGGIGLLIYLISGFIMPEEPVTIIELITDDYPKKLLKSNRDRVFAGVCGGIAEYLNINSMLVRIGWLIFTFCGGAGILAYVICSIIIPSKRF